MLVRIEGDNVIIQVSKKQAWDILNYQEHIIQDVLTPAHIKTNKTLTIQLFDLMSADSNKEKKK